MWKTVNTILNTSYSSVVQSRFEIYGFETSDSSLISQNFIEYFARVGNNSAPDFDDEYWCDSYLSNLGERLENEFDYISVSVFNIKAILDYMKNSAPGCNDKPIEI